MKQQRDYTINKKIAQVIEESDKKPTAIADKANIRRDTFSRILHCKRPIYSEEIVPICNAIGISVSFLYSANSTNC